VAHAPSQRADMPDWRISRLGSCAASRFTADGCRLCCSTPELSAIPKFRFARSAFSDNRIELRHLRVIGAVKSEDPSHLCGAIGLLLLVLFVLVERRTRSPLVPMELFQNRNFTGANLLTLFLYGALFCNAVLSSSKPHSGLSRLLPLGLRPS
jgi:hypothetical protein